MIKKISIVIAAIACVLALTLALLLWNINPILAGLKSKINETISKQIGQEVSLGEVTLSFFPQFGVDVQDIRLVSQDSAQVEANLGSLLIKTNPYEILSGQFSVSEIVVRDLSVKAVRLKNGSLVIAGIPLQGRKDIGNKEQAGESLDRKSDNTDTPLQENGVTSKLSSSLPVKEEEKQAPLRIALQNVTLQNINLELLDQRVSPEQRITVNNIHGSLSDIDLSGKARVSLKAGLLDNNAVQVSLEGVVGNPLSGSPTNLDGRIDVVDLKRFKDLLSAYGRNDLPIQMSGATSWTIGIKTTGKGGLELKSNLNASPSEIAYGSSFTKSLTDALSLELDAGVPTGGTGNAEIKTLKLSVGPASADFKSSLPVLSFYNFMSQGNLPVSATMPFDLSFGSGSLADLIKLFPAYKDLNLSGHTNLNLSGQLPLSPVAESFTPESLGLVGSLDLKDIGFQLPTSTMRIDRLSGSITLGGDLVKSKDLSLDIFGQPVSLSLGVKNLSSPIAALSLDAPIVKLEPVLDGLALDLPQLKESQLEKIKVSGSFASANNTGDATLLIDRASLASIPISAVALNAAFSPERVSVSPGSVQIAGGQLKFKSILTHKPVSTLVFQVEGGGIDVGTISKGLSPTARVRLEGKLSSLSLSGSANPNLFSGSLDSKTELLVKDGRIEGFNIFKSVMEKIENVPSLKGRIAPYIPEEFKPLLTTDSTPFDSLSASVSTKNGKAVIAPLMLAHKAFEIRGVGSSVIAGNQSGNLELKTEFSLTPVFANAVLVKEPKLRLLLDDKGNLVIPVLIKIENKNPAVYPDLEELIRRAAANTAKETSRKAIEGLLPQEGKQAAKLLDKLFQSQR